MQEFDISRILLPYFQRFCIAEKINGFELYTNLQKSSRYYIPIVNYLAWWSRGMIRASGARGPGFNSRPSPTIFFLLDEIIKIKWFGIVGDRTRGLLNANQTLYH